jgi:hypothetical protein
MRGAGGVSGKGTYLPVVIKTKGRYRKGYYYSGN